MPSCMPSPEIAPPRVAIFIQLWGMVSAVHGMNGASRGL